MFNGHNKQIEFFRHALTNNKMMHAYIFSGISGIGKGIFAHNIAKALLCKEKNYFTKCSCSSCKQIDNNSHPDLSIYEKNKLSIENIRDIINSASMTPLIGKWKVFILKDAELLSSSNYIASANALLKILEEPPLNTLFLLITDQYEKVLPTIRSRASLIKFNRLTDTEVKQILMNLYPDEKYFDTIVKFSNGSVEKAIKLLNSNYMDYSDLLSKKDFKTFASNILSIQDKESLELAISSIYPYILKEYKQSGKITISELNQYLVEISKRFNYNINFELTKIDFISKIIEVFSERV